MAVSGIEVEIYKDSAPFDKLGIIEARQRPSLLREVRGVGAGSFQIAKNNPKILSDPSLLDYRNFVRIRVNGVCLGGFILTNKDHVIVGEGEQQEEVWSISGEGLRSWGKDAEVHPAGGVTKFSRETRYFNFSTAQGAWYNPAQWVAATHQFIWYGGGPSNSPWGTAPSDWPDAPTAWWIWDRHNPADWNSPLGSVYLRKEFSLAAEGQYALFFAVDDAAEVYIDGELIHTTADHAWQETTRLDVDLAAGAHVLAFKATQTVASSPGGLIAAFYKIGNATNPTAASQMFVSDSSWKVCGYPAVEPGWSPGTILLTLLNEAESRGIRFANNWTPTFTDLHDSAGVLWGDPISISFDVGMNYEDVFQALEEVACDIFVDPETLQLHAWKTRGVDRSVDGFGETINGTNIYTNDGSDVTGWTTSIEPNGSGATATTVSSQTAGSTPPVLRVSTNGTTAVNPAPAGTALRTLTTIPGVSYTVSGAALNGLAGTRAYVSFGTADWASTGTPSTEVPFSFTFVATGTQTVLKLRVEDDPASATLRASSRTDFDNIVVHQSAYPAPLPNPIVLRVGHNLRTADEKGQADIVNTLLLRTSDGWQVVQPSDTTSVTKYGVLEGQLSTEMSSAAASGLVGEVFRKKALPEKTATFELIPVPNMVPFENFLEGDYVSAPGEVPGVLEKRRVMSISVTENEVGDPVYAVEFDAIFGDRLSDLEKMLSRATHSSGLGGGFTGSTGTPQTPTQGSGPQLPVSAPPVAPTGIVVSTVGRWADNGSAVSDYGLTWNGVISNVNNLPVTDIESYEIWSRRSTDTTYSRTSTVFDTFAYLSGYNPGEDWYFQIRAISRTGGVGYFSPPVHLIAAAPIVPLGAPSTPTLVTELGSVAVKWDGLIAGAAVPSRFKHVEIQRSTTQNGTYVVVGSFVSGSGVDSTGVVGTTYWYRLVAVDYLNVKGTASLAASIQVAGVSTSELDQAIQDAINGAVSDAAAALVAANGKGRNIYGTAAQRDAKAPFTEFDTWFDTANENRIHRWTGSAWEATSLGSAALGSDVNDAISDAANVAAAAVASASTAQTTANSKNTIYRQAAEPTGGVYKDGDTWFDTDDGNRIYVRSGALWVDAQDRDIFEALQTAQIANSNSEQYIADPSFLLPQPSIPVAQARWTVKQGGGYYLSATGGGYVVGYNPTTAAYVVASAKIDATLIRDGGFYFLGTGSTIEIASNGSYVFNGAPAFIEIHSGANPSPSATPLAIQPLGAYGTVIRFKWTNDGASAVALTIRLRVDTTNGTNQMAVFAGITARDITPLQNALTAANGKNKNYYQTAEPVGTSHTVGDTWFDTDNDNRIHRWTGSAWVASMLGGNAIAEQSIVNAHIQDATIQNAKIANLDAAKITTGFMSADRIAAGSLVIGKVSGLQTSLDGKETPAGAQAKADAAKAEALIADALKTGSGTVKSFFNPLVWSMSVSGQVGSLVIKTPITFTNYMTNIRVKGYNFSTTDGVDIDFGVGFYAYSVGTSFPTSFQTNVGSLAVSVRLARDPADNTVVLILDNPAGRWYYTKINITEATLGHTMPPDSFKDGWSASIMSDVSAYLNVVVPPSRDLNDTHSLTQGWRTTGQTTINGGQITTDTILAGAIKAWTVAAGQAIIADATITNAKIANLDAAKITTGFLDAARLQANTISTSKLLVTSMENLLQDPGFEYGSAAVSLDTTKAWTIPAGTSIDTVNPRSGTNVLKVTTTTGNFIAASQNAPVAVAEGERYRVASWVRLDSGVSASTGVALRFKYGATESSVTSTGADVAVTPVGTGTTYVRIAGEWAVPAGAKFAKLEIVSRDIVAGKIFRVDDLECFKMTTGELIVDGSVTAAKMLVGTITAASGIIADAAITNAKIANLDAAKITTGVLDADRIGANTITSKKILVANLDNQLDNPNFETNTFVGWEQTGSTAGWDTPTSSVTYINRYLRRTTTTAAAVGHVTNGFRVAVRPGQRIRIDALSYCDGIAAGAWTETRRNYFPDPLATTTDHFILPVAGTYSLVNDMPGTIPAAVRFTRTTAGSARIAMRVGATMFRNTNGRFRLRVRASEATTVGVYVRPDAASTTGQTAINASYAIPSGVSEIDLTGAAGSTAAAANTSLVLTISAGTVGATLDLTNISIETSASGALGAPLNGSLTTTSDLEQYAWAGTANNSQSVYQTRTAPSSIGVQFYTPAGAALTYVPRVLVTSAAWAEITWETNVPDSAYFASLRVEDAGLANTTLRLANLQFRLMGAAQLLVDGTIQGRHVATDTLESRNIKAGTIEVDRLSPNVGSSLNLDGQTNITALTNIVAAQQATLLAHQQTSSSVAAATDAAALAASLAEKTAQLAQYQANGLQAGIENTQAGLENLGRTYRFTAEGAFVGSPGSPYEFVIQNNGAEIRYNGVSVSSWDSGRMIVNSFVGNEVVLGNHKLEKDDNTTGTVVRKIESDS